MKNLKLKYIYIFVLLSCYFLSCTEDLNYMMETEAEVINLKNKKEFKEKDEYLINLAASIALSLQESEELVNIMNEEHYKNYDGENSIMLK